MRNLTEIKMYFCDTYALIELIRGNPKYEEFGNFKVVCILNNLFELHQSLLKQFNKKTADFWMDKFSIIDVTTEDIIKASDFRFKYRKDKLSMTDCIGYCVAKRNKLKFLTGDEKFKNKDNVEFVK
ncbi:type II toxin-antitoxin system VapC family toxin [Candidatus Pacearchaeota archaeon]|nr:MAG: type II toxin-antitoxin system VapC family toxin [Candidatus Pacearchaeota archaeon]